VNSSSYWWYQVIRRPRIVMSTGEINGFTLLEILIAIFIFSVILGTIFTSYTGTFKIIDDTEAQAEIYGMARMALQRIIEDLGSAYMIGQTESPEAEAEPIEKAGFLGEDREIRGRDADTVRFLSRASLDLEEEGGESGIRRIAYQVVEEGDGNSLALYRSDTSELVEDDERGRAGQILCNRLSAIKFTYFDADGNRHDHWDSAQEEFRNKLPVRASILLEFTNERDPEAPVRFLTGIALPTAMSGSEKDRGPRSDKDSKK
jgi:general secretion pathway protein J